MKVLLILAAALLFAGCSPSAHRIHTTAVGVLAGAHEVAGRFRDDARGAALDRVEARYPEVGQARSAALDAEQAHWAPSADGLDAVRSALPTWLSALELARAADDGGAVLAALLPLAARALALYDDVARMLRGLDVEAPALPDAVRAVIGGAL